MAKNQTIKIEIDPAPKGELKVLGGAGRDQWNERLSTLVTRALPVNQKDVETVSLAGSAAIAGIVDMKPTDPIEGVLIAQVVVAYEAAMKLYRLGWANITEYFEAGTKYLQLADKAMRTVAILTERLDQHRNRGQQQIVVKHVTVNADQAVVTDSVVAGNPASSTELVPAILTDGVEKPMPRVVAANQPQLAGERRQK